MIDNLEGLIRGSDTNAAAAAVEALVRIGGARAEALLRERLSAPDLFLRVSIVEGLTRLGTRVPWEELKPAVEDAIVRRISAELPESQVHGEWMGFVKIGAAAQPLLRQLTAELLSAPDGHRATLDDLLQALATSDRDVEVFYTTGHWLDVDRLADLGPAGTFETRGDIR